MVLLSYCSELLEYFRVPELGTQASPRGGLCSCLQLKSRFLPCPCFLAARCVCVCLPLVHNPALCSFFTLVPSHSPSSSHVHLPSSGKYPNLTVSAPLGPPPPLGLNRMLSLSHPMVVIVVPIFPPTQPGNCLLAFLSRLHVPLGRADCLVLGGHSISVY